MSRRPIDRRVDDLVAGLFTLGCVATLLVTTWIAVRSVDGVLRLVGDPFALGQSQALLAGLVSAHLMLVQVLLLARLPSLERSWGRARLVRRHRLLAQWSFWLMLIHVALFALQRATRRPGDLGGAWWALFVTGRHMLWASLGTLMILLVVASSIAIARRRLRYETWHLLHLWSYVGMVLALPHMLTSVDFGSTWATTYWWALYLLTLAAVLWWRVLVPLIRSARLGLRVSEVRPEAGGATSVTMTGRDLDRLGARSGQFLVWRFLGGRGWTRGHPYSLSAAPDSTRLRVTVGGDGDGARRIAGLRPGGRVIVEGPYGEPLPRRRRHPRLLLIAAGVGVTPFRALLEDTSLRPGEATVIVRVGDEASVVLGEELRELCGRRGVELVVLAGPRRTPLSWLPAGVDGGPAEVLTRLVPDVARCDVLICGPPDWMTAVVTAAVRAGVADRDLQLERFEI